MNYTTDQEWYDKPDDSCGHILLVEVERIDYGFCGRSQHESEHLVPPGSPKALQASRED